MTSSDPPAQRFADTESLSRSLATQIAANLAAGIGARGVASLVVSGGRTPIQLFEILRKQPLDWSRVCVALADERWVAADNAASNERLVRDQFRAGLSQALASRLEFGGFHSTAFPVLCFSATPRLWWRGTGRRAGWCRAGRRSR